MFDPSSSLRLVNMYQHVLSQTNHLNSVALDKINFFSVAYVFLKKSVISKHVFISFQLLVLTVLSTSLQRQPSQ